MRPVAEQWKMYGKNLADYCRIHSMDINDPESERQRRLCWLECMKIQGMLETAYEEGIEKGFERGIKRGIERGKKIYKAIVECAESLKQGTEQWMAICAEHKEIHEAMEMLRKGTPLEEASSYTRIPLEALKLLESSLTEENFPGS